ncbi:MAG: GH3 auxin-responsive promoter family protein [Planctomycetes bacterium]|nr:GH3 auxin-responsive promoter family protein [Planctomycetota bacterium]
MQKRTLLEKIKRNRDSKFGRDHSFSKIRTVEDFRRNVELGDYQHFRPYIDRVKEGDMRALFGPSEKLIMFSMTSGTTGSPKYIPVTTSFAREYKRSSLVWAAFAYLDHRGMPAEKLLPVVSSMCESFTRQGVPCGAMSGFHAQTQHFVGRSMYAVPTCVFDITDPEARYYTLMRIAARHSVSFLSTPNPSTVITIARTLDTHHEKIVKDIHDGTLSDAFDVANDIRLALRLHLRPNPRRARELGQIASDAGRLYPRDIWPDLALIASWKGGPLVSYLPLYEEYYGNVPVRDLGLLASEGRMSIPHQDEGGGGILDIQGAFFEFIPEGEEDAEHPDTLLCHELEEGKRYFVVLTTSAGLYRYNIYDLVEVTGFFNATPVIAFLNKGKHISSITGEKITESQVTQAVMTVVAELGVVVETFQVSPTWDEVPYYSIYVEDGALRDGVGKDFLKAVERNLRALNMEYESKRKSGRLGHMVLKFIGAGTFDALRAEHIKKRGRAEQYKHPFLVPDVDHSKRLRVVSEVAAEE